MTKGSAWLDGKRYDGPGTETLTTINGHTFDGALTPHAYIIFTNKGTIPMNVDVVCS